MGSSTDRIRRAAAPYDDTAIGCGCNWFRLTLNAATTQDFFADQVNINRGGQRTATVLMYLSDVAEGCVAVSASAAVCCVALCTSALHCRGLNRTLLLRGETIFPNAAPGRATCTCGGKEVRGLCVQPRKGDAVLFWTMQPNGAEDSMSLHGGCEVLDGTKWSATLWIRTGKFT